MVSFAKYRVSRYFAPLLVCSYVTVAVFTTHVNGGEVFPFFNWSLFSYSANLRTNYALRLLSINGHSLPSPRLYFDMKETFVHARQRDVNLSKAVRTLVDALLAGDKEEVGRARGLIEQRYMADVSSAEYDIVDLTYDPIQRLRTGEIKGIVVLATYDKTPK